ncbi:glycosyl transferase family protein [Antarctobacter jejuensis]|uniref:glycosyl transferase family protein n=1 Tax=Antarctobacter jejuensis TaxID=1439938 RepID=UPI003FD4953A
MSLSEHVRTLGRGPGRSRSLTEDEAVDAMSQMLQGAAPEAVGALLMLLRMKGETKEEIAGFARAAQGALGDWPRADLDWPCYAAGRTRGLPWFLLAAKLVADQGHRVLLHGWNGRDTAIRDGIAELGIPVVRTAEEAAQALDAHCIAYLPLEVAHPALFRLLDLRDTLGLRSCVNTVCRMLNPGRASASVQGVFHPPYRLLQADAAELLGWRNLTVIKGGGGEFERHPGKLVEGFGLRNGTQWQRDFQPISRDARRLADFAMPAGSLAALWQHDEAPEFARDLVLGTALLAFETLGLTNPDIQALWNLRESVETV